MINKKISESEEAVQLKSRIENWRKNKTSKKMPEELWGAAVLQSRDYTPSAVAKFLKIGYLDLIKRIPDYFFHKNLVKKEASHGFIELPSLIGVPNTQRMEVYLLHSEGQSAVIHHTGSALDWESLFTGWFKASCTIQRGNIL
jgi:hypothetical protein